MDTLGTFWMPQQGSTVAPEVDALYYFLLYLSFFFMALIYSVTIYFSWKYRRRGKRDVITAGPDQNHRLEVTWTVIPTLIVLVIFAWGFKGYLHMNIAPGDAMDIRVNAQQWFWSFEYPNGANSVNELVVPEDRPVRLLMQSKDVIHSFYVPEFRIKMDVLPNRYTTTWFQAVHSGEFNIFCAEYCGKGHSEMLAKVRAMPYDEYVTWTESQAVDSTTPLDELGKKLYTSKTCVTCHTLDGSKGQGPTFKGVFGRKETLEDGSTITVNEEYIRHSLMDPQSQIVKGFPPVMPTFQGLLKDREIDAIIAFLKTVK